MVEWDFNLICTLTRHGTIWLVHVAPFHWSTWHWWSRWLKLWLMMTEIPGAFFAMSASGGSHLPHQRLLGWHVASYGPHTCIIFCCSSKTSEGNNFFIWTPFNELKIVLGSSWLSLRDAIGFMRFLDSEFLSYLRSSRILIWYLVRKLGEH